MPDLKAKLRKNSSSYVKSHQLNDSDEFCELLSSCGESWGKLFLIYNSGQIMKLDVLKNDLGFVETKERLLLRTSFWNEYALAKKTKLKYFPMQLVYTGICYKSRFLGHLEDDKFCHYLLNPCIDYSLELLNILNEHGVSFYSRMLMLPDYELSDDGNKCTLNFDRKMKLYKFKFDLIRRLEDRVQGGTVQKSEIREIGDNRSGDGLRAIEDMGLEEVTAKLKLIEETKKNIRVGSLDDPVDASYKIVNDEVLK